MGTYWRVSFYADAEVDVGALEKRCHHILSDVISTFSLWEETSFLSKLNAAPAGTSFPVTSSFKMVWSVYLELQSRTGPVFSPLVSEGGHIQPERQPDLSTLEESDTIFRPDGFVFDLNAVAKGFAVDLIGQALTDAGILSFLVDIGGDFYSTGLKPNNSPFWVDLDRRVTDPSVIRIALIDQGVASSGQLEQAELLQDGYTSHIRGAKVFLNSSVTVIQENCMLADAWATALFASGDAGLDLANENGIPAIFCESGHPIRFSDEAFRYLEQ